MMYGYLNLQWEIDGPGMGIRAVHKKSKVKNYDIIHKKVIVNKKGEGMTTLGQ